MNRRSFLQSAAIVSFLGQIPEHAQSALSDGRSVKEGKSGLEARYDLSLHRVLQGHNPAYTPELLLADIRASGGRRYTNFSGDLSGRYVGALSSVARQKNLTFPGLDDLVIKIISEQHKEGFFGSSFDFHDPKDDDLALLWGNGRLLIGLLEYHQYRPSAAVLSATQALGNFLVRIGPLMNSESMRSRFDADHYGTSYICWTQNIESLIALYRATHDQAYLKLGRQIAAYTKYRPGEHAHGFLTSLRGIGELHRLTGEAEYLASMESEWQRIADSENLLPTGGIPERWMPLKKRTEGCAEADWIRLNLGLWGATKNERYLLAAERTIFNEFQLNHFCDGDFGHRVLNATGIDGTNAVRAWWCCSLHGLRCFPEIERAAFRLEKGAIHYDLPVSARSADGELDITAVSTIESNAAVLLRVSEAGGSSAVPIRIRKPVWAEGLLLKANGSAIHPKELNAYVTIERKWRSGDQIEIRYKMGIRREQKAEDSRVALFYGPWLLGVDKLDSESYFNEETAENLLKMDDSRPARSPESSSSASAFLVPESHFPVGYVPAEYPMQPGVTVLRAVSEQTRMPTTDWQFLFTQKS